MKQSSIVTQDSKNEYRKNKEKDTSPPKQHTHDTIFKTTHGKQSFDVSQKENKTAKMSNQH